MTWPTAVGPDCAGGLAGSNLGRGPGGTGSDGGGRRAGEPDSARCDAIVNFRGEPRLQRGPQCVHQLCYELTTVAKFSPYHRNHDRRHCTAARSLLHSQASTVLSSLRLRQPQATG